MTMGEVARTLNRMDQSLRDLRHDLAPVIEHDAADAEWRKSMEARVMGLETFQTWAVRLVLGAVLLGVLSVGFLTA